jgi:hypothetical protein
MPHPNVHQYLDASTAHLPADLLQSLGAIDGVIARQFREGWWLWVPEDVPGQLADYERLPTAIVTLWHFARARECNWVLLDADAPEVDELPTYEHAR